jgi:hypothetical protein
MTTPAARDRSLRRLSDLTTWIGVAAVGVTGVFAGFAAHASHHTATAQSAATVTNGGLTSAQAPAAATTPSHVRSGAS